MNKTVGLVSLGCAKNRVDSETILGMLTQAGWENVYPPENAELVIINTCGFIESAKEEAISTILEFIATRAETGMPKKIMVTGCLSQRYPNELYAELPEVDGFLGVSDYSRLLEAVDNVFKGERPVYCERCDRFDDAPRVLTTPKWSAYVKISDGCDNKCTYCAIPLIRGAYRSRPYDSIMNECRDLAANGVTEIVLIAQDTSRYGNDFPEKKTLLSRLLRDVNDIDGIRWVRVLYCYPDTVDEELLDTIAELPKACRYLDLPLQHINAEMLRRMNRRGSPEDIRRVIDMCRERDISVRTTFIVGFPGETDEMFEELLSFVREARFDRLGAFTFSPEDGTLAAEMPDQIPEDVKQERYDRLMRVQQGISKAAQRKRLGTVCEVLCEGRDRHGRYIGRSRLEAPEVDGTVFFTSSAPVENGRYVDVRINAVKAYDLFGEAVE